VGFFTFWRWSASPQAAPFCRFIGSTHGVRRGWPFIFSEWIRPGLVAGFILGLIYSHFFLSHGWADEEASLLKEVTQTETVFLREKGEIQITTSLDFSIGEKEDLLAFPFAIEYGLSDVWEAELEWDTFLFKDPDHEFSTHGIGDLRMGTKYSFLNIGGSNFHIAPGFEIDFPLASVNKDLSDGFMRYEPSLVLALDFPNWNFLQFFTEIGVGLLDRVKEPDDEEDREPKAHELTWDTGFILPLHEEALITFEFNWETNEWNNNGTDSEMYITPGLDWEFLDDWEFNVEIQIGVNHDADDYKINATLTYEFDLFEEDEDA
jgi:hypothetical protein